MPKLLNASQVLIHPIINPTTIFIHSFFFTHNGEKMCSCFRSRVSLDCDSKRKRESSNNENVSFSVSPSIRDISVRIVHAGGRIELFPKAIRASELIEKNPGMCITRPHIFTAPHESVLSADDMLVPGNKYFVVRSTTVEKLKRRHKATRVDDSKDETMGDDKKIDDDNRSEESVGGVKDFYVPKENWSNYFEKKCGEKRKQFVPPIQKARMWKVDWEPSLNSIKEVSP